MFLLVLNSLYILEVCGISLTRLKDSRKFLPFSFVNPSVKCDDNFRKVRGVIDRFNELRRKIASGIEKCHMSQ